MGFIDRIFGPPSESRFAELLIDAFADAGDRRDYVYDAGGRRLVTPENGKEALAVNLTNLYATYLQVPKRKRAAWLHRTALGFLTAENMEPEDFEDVKPDLLPMLRSRTWTELARLRQELTPEGTGRIASVRVSELLSACLVYDLPESMRFINVDDLEQWGVSIYEAVEIAMRNLDRLPVSEYLSVSGLVYVISSGDSYDATRMLSLEWMGSLELEGAPIALPVTRDCLLVAGSANPEALRIMVELAEQHMDDPRPICAVPHILRDDGWEVWPVPPDHPAAPGFQMLGLRSLFAEYEEQKEILQQWAEQRGHDAFVASLTAGEHRGDGRVRTFTQLTKGVPTWLPCADRVAFFDRDAEAIRYAAWDEALSMLGEQARPLEHWPRRWAVSGFPSAEEFAALSPDRW